MENSLAIRKKYHSSLNTYHLFESFLYGEFYSKISQEDDFKNSYLESLENNEYYIDKEFLIYLFNEIWIYSEQIDTNVKLREDFIDEILNSSNKNDDFIRLTREFYLFDFDYSVLEEIKNYSLEFISKNNNKMKIKYFYKNYFNSLKSEMISKFKVELLVSEDSFCFN